ncbi:MAG: AAA family ATPase, partial [Kiritimatiellae bacterium]|nr:AAA family ATPase [Kiritimatiellia bacterium]
GKGVVILVDEYDAPVGHCLDDIAMAEAVRDRLSAVYSQMKNRTGDIRFLLMTGVSKFTRLSVFSALSTIVDVSQKDEYATMFGYTEDELSTNFDEHLRDHAKIMGRSYEDYRAEMKRWYNGFRFARNDSTTVYNPISVALTLFNKEKSGFSATWATTGRPSMLMNYLKREEVVALDYDDLPEVTEDEFDVAELRKLRPIAMFYQSGYLTIKGYDDGFYKLGVPDEEVRRDLAKLVTGAMADEDMQWAASLGAKLVTARWPEFFVGLKSLYAHLPYGPKEDEVQEFSYERVLYALLASLGVEVVSEDRQSNGRSDIVAKHKKGIFIFELKVGDPVDKAFKQIREKGYAEPYVADGRPIWLIGLSFDPKIRRLVDFAAEKF